MRRRAPIGTVWCADHRTWARAGSEATSGQAPCVTLAGMALHPSVVDRLARLTVDQRAAATAPPGPVLCVAPAGSGKTTTLVARIAWLIGSGVPPESIAAITFNKRAAEELAERLDAAIAPLGVAVGTVRVRTFHALGREILSDAGLPVEPLLDRAALVAELWPDTTAPDLGRLDTAFSRLKLDLGVSAAEIAADPEAGPLARAFVAYEAAIAARGGLDFDDLVRGALDALERDRTRWHAGVSAAGTCSWTRSRMSTARSSAWRSCWPHPGRIFLVGDDDQSIYGWRLADVRRVLALDANLRGLRRVDLEVNHRCPVPVVERAVRLIEHNRERFAKVVRPRPDAPGRLILAPDAADEPARTERLMRAWPDDDGTRAILARTNRELRPAVVAALALGEPFRAPSVELLVDDPALDRPAPPGRGRDPPAPAVAGPTWGDPKRPHGARHRGGTGSCRGPARLGDAVPRPTVVRHRDRSDAIPAGGAATRRRPPQPGNGPLHQRRRIRSRRRHRHGGGSVPERPGDRRVR